MLKRTARRLLAWSVVFAMLFSLTVQPAAAADTSGDSSAAAYSVQADEDAADESTEAEPAEEEAETDPADADSGEANESADESAEEPADESGEEATLTVSAAAATVSEEEEEAETTVTASAYDEPATDSDGVYQISTASELFWFAELVNSGTADADAVLTADIDLESEEWTPIGDYDSDASLTYTGTFDGGGFTVSGLYIVVGANLSNYGGLFGYVGDGGTVQNLTVEGSVTAVRYAAGIAGYVSSEGAVNNCTNKASVTGNTGYAGGVVGYCEGNITSCTNSGTVKGSDYVGGVVGYSEGEMTDCENSGGVTGYNYYVGGVVGYCTAAVSDSSNSGTVKGAVDVGGVVGYCTGAGALTNCTNSGTVTGQGNNTGGVVGYCDGDISNCTNCDSGTVSSSQYVGGVVAYATGTVSDCSNSATVSGIQYVGGIVGLIEAELSDCENTGEITASGSNVGGIAGKTNSEISNCTNSGAVTGADQVGGVVGNSTSAVTACTNEGDVTITGSGSSYYAGGVAGYIDGGTVTDCINNGDVSVTSSAYAGGVVGYNTGTLIDCTNSGTVTGQGNYAGGVVGSNTGSVSGCSNSGAVSNSSSPVGGVIGYNTGSVSGCSNSETVTGSSLAGGVVCLNSNSGTVTNCYNTGSISGNSAPTGGVVGNGGTITNCYNTGSVSGTVAAITGGVAGGGTVTNCYYLEGTSQNSYGTSVTADQLASGEVAYLLNESVSGGDTWFQNLDNGKTVDASPVLDSTHGAVYYGYTCTSTTAGYSNSQLYDTTGHTYDDNGFCTKCGAYEPAEQNSDGYYEIDNAGKLFWFAALVNGDTTQEDVTEAVSGANAVLTADIDLSVTTDTHTSTKWTPIGNYSSNSISYTGTFDGRGYTISGLYINNSSRFQGLFGYVSSGGRVQNVTVSGRVSGTNNVGGVVGYNDSGTVTGCTSNATVTSSSFFTGGVVGNNYGSITNCYSTGRVTGGGNSAGGVAGYNGDTGTITNCYNTGAVSSSKTYAGGVAAANSGTIANCYSTGAVSGSSYVGGLLGNSYSGTITNCYYLDTVGSDSYATAKTADEFASGEVAYLLNESVSGGATWFQTIGTDETPVLDSSHGMVYYGYTCTSTTAGYSNSQLYDTTGHTYDDNGFCTKCGAYEPAELNSDGYYEIDNTGKLFWFAALVNGDTTQENVTEAVSGANAILTADIDLSGREWTPIGDGQSYSNSTDNRPMYTGTFDGDGYTISGLTISNELVGQGLFGFMKGGTVKNLTLAEVNVEAGSYSGAVVGTIYGGSISNVAVISGSVTTTGDRAGGLAGRVRTYCTVSGCYNAATVTAGGSYAGGICGDLWNGGTITNCYNIGTVSGSYSVGGITGLIYNGSAAITNCYSMGTLSSSGTVGGIVGEVSGTHTISNNYYLDTTADTGIASGDGEATAKTANEFASGEVAWLLQSSQNEQVWGQALTGDAEAYPVLTDEAAKLVVKLDFYLVEDSEVSATAFDTRYTNYEATLASYPSSDETTYVFYTAETCADEDEIDTAAYTYSADCKVYVATKAETFTVWYGETEITLDADETYDLTQAYDDELGYGVPEGYLYGGTFTDEDFAEVIDPDTCGSGVEFTPEAGETYYVKLVDDSYFMLKCLLAYEGYVPTNLWLVTNIDSNAYCGYGFNLIYGEDDEDVVDIASEDAAKQLYQELELNGKVYTGTVDISNFTGFSSADYDESDETTNLVGYYDLSDSMSDLLEMGEFTVVPFFVTQDGVKVTGAVERTISLTDTASSVSKMYSVSDKTVASTTEEYDGEVDDEAAAIMLTSYLNVSATALITNIDDGEEPATYTITKYDGDAVTTQEVEEGATDVTVEYTDKDGYLFAGWFTDEDYTTAADFSEITGDMTVYAKYVSADYLQVKASTVSSKGVVKSIRMISATDSKNYAEVGFVYQYGDVESSVEVTKYSTSISGKTAKTLYGGSVVAGSKLIYADLSVSGMEAGTAVTITPYWVTLDGTTVYGTERTITYTGSGIE